MENVIINIGGVYIRLNFSGVEQEARRSFLKAISCIAVNSRGYDAEVNIVVIKDDSNARKELLKMEEDIVPRTSGWRNVREFIKQGLIKESIVSRLLLNKEFRKAWDNSRRSNLFCYIYRCWIALLYLYRGHSLEYFLYILDGDELRLGKKARNLMLEHLLFFIFLHAMPRLSKGVLLHAAGVRKTDKAAVFLAESGGGKSTAAEMLKRYERDIEVFSDESTLLTRKRDGDYYISCLPRGEQAELKNIDSDSAPLKTLFFLKKADNIYIRKIGEIDAFKRLFKITSLVHINAEKTANRNNFHFCSRLLKNLPSYELGFRKDDNFWPLCESVLSEQ